MENFIQMMFDLSDVVTYQEPTSGLSERRVRTSPLPDTEKVLKETEVPLSVKYSEQLVSSKKPIDPNGLSTKMLRECLAATEGMTSPPSSLKWSNWGMISNGKCSTQKISEYHKTGKESILLDILENGGGKYQIFPLQTADGETDIPEIKQIAQRNSATRDNLNQYRVYDPEGIGPALNTANGGGRESHIPVFGIDYNAGDQERPIANCISARYNSGVTRHSQEGTAVCVPVLTPERAEKRQNGRRFKDNGEEAFTLTSQDRHGVMLSSDAGEQLNAVWYEKYQCYIAIRKLTPRECFRLQGWTDDYFDKAQFVNSDCQLYKQAGNGVTVAVVEEIGRAIAEVEKNE